MNDIERFALNVEYTTGKKRGRHPVFSSSQFYPYAAERRLQNSLRNELERYMAEAFGAATAGENFVADTLEDLSRLPDEISEDMKNEIAYASDAIARKVSISIAEMTEMTIGKPYYPPAAKQEILTSWEANFQTLCKSAKSDMKKEMSMIVQQAKNEGWNGKQLEREIRNRLPEKYAGRAKNIARTETGKLNTAITLSTYKEIGIQYYVWMATMDERTRPDHAMMNGLICSATDPTVWYEENPDDPMHPIEHKRDDTMVHLHPGDDFQCRCTMVMWDPVVDGKYEVKEGEKPEEEPEEGQQGAGKATASQELEKATEALAEKEKELERVKNEAKTAEKELANEKSARKAAEKAKTEAEDAVKSEKASRVEAEARAKDEERRKVILQEANARHAKRTEEHRQAVRVAHAQRQNKYEICNELSISIPKKGMGHEKADSGNTNPSFMVSSGYRINCQSCVPIYELRKKYGIDVTTKKCPRRGDGVSVRLSLDTADVYRTVDGSRRELQPVPLGRGGGYEKFLEELNKLAKAEGDYALQMYWRRGSGGHIINFTKYKDGSIRFFDNQRSGNYAAEITGERMEQVYFLNANPQRWSAMRIDDLVFNKEVIKGIMEPKSVKALQKELKDLNKKNGAKKK